MRKRLFGAVMLVAVMTAVGAHGFTVDADLPAGNIVARIGGGQGADCPVCVSGIYPHLAMFNDEGECGTGAVVPWAGDLWVVTYGSHCPLGSTDKLYRIKPDLTREKFEGSEGGTHANRMIHRETNQMLIGPYVIDATGMDVRCPSRAVLWYNSPV